MAIWIEKRMIIHWKISIRCPFLAFWHTPLQASRRQRKAWPDPGFYSGTLSFLHLVCNPSMSFYVYILNLSQFGGYLLSRVFGCVWHLFAGGEWNLLTPVRTLQCPISTVICQQNFNTAWYANLGRMDVPITSLSMVGFPIGLSIYVHGNANF